MRDLRNRGGEVVDRAAGGERITVTRSGEPVAERITVTRSGEPVAELTALSRRRLSGEVLLQRCQATLGLLASLIYSRKPWDPFATHHPRAD
ncbi:MAG: type II toxin-antitoxin system Phd/YefM family antitoxin [Solirubrobacteraceae bacterium]